MSENRTLVPLGAGNRDKERREQLTDTKTNAGNSSGVPQ
jgi:hypothetical protein